MGTRNGNSDSRNHVENVEERQWEREKGWKDYGDTLSLKDLPSLLVTPTSTHLSISSG